jgi:hypothetical protein
MTQVAGPETVLGDFSLGSVRALGETVGLRREGERFFATVIKPGWRGAEEGEPERVEREIALVTGRHHMQIYWYSVGHKSLLARVPVAWDVQDAHWFPTDSNFVQVPHDEDAVPVPRIGVWNHGCIQCHVTDGRPHWADTRRTEVSEFGIACEACHGPGEAHATSYRDPTRRYADHLTDGSGEPGASTAAGESDRRDVPVTPAPIVNPSTLRHDRGSQVCGRCHSVWSFSSNEAYSDYMVGGVPFLPGDDLQEANITLLTRYAQAPDSFWPDDQVRPSGREYSAMLDSPCYRAGELSCFSCHSMHAPGDATALEAWRDDQLKPGMRGNAACLQCHDAYTEPAALAAHSLHRPSSSGSECQNCHTPYTSQGLRKAIRSHTVTSPSVAVDLATGRPNACSGCHLDKPLAWIAEALTKGYGQPSPILDDTDRKVPAAVVDALRGDAGQRALAAWALSWPPAVAASGAQEWAAAVLAPLLIDPYPAVRSIAGRSLRSLPGYEDFAYSWVDPPEERAAAAAKTAQHWRERRRAAGQPGDLGFLLSGDGSPAELRILSQLRQQRDDRPVRIAE